MKWIGSLVNSKIFYYTYKLYKNDSAIIHYSKYNHSKLIIILYGSVYVTKTFESGEIVPIVILDKNTIFTAKRDSGKFYYKLTALETTYILSTKVYRVTNNRELMNNLIKGYKETVEAYETMNDAINQKYVERRVFYALLMLFWKFGVISNKKVKLPFWIPQRNLGNIANTRKEIVSRVIKKLDNKLKIKYYSKKLLYINNVFNITVK